MQLHFGCVPPFWVLRRSATLFGTLSFIWKLMGRHLSHASSIAFVEDTFFHPSWDGLIKRNRRIKNCRCPINSRSTISSMYTRGEWLLKDEDVDKFMWRVVVRSIFLCNSLAPTFQAVCVVRYWVLYCSSILLYYSEIWISGCRLCFIWIIRKSGSIPLFSTKVILTWISLGRKICLIRI